VHQNIFFLNALTMKKEIRLLGEVYENSARNLPDKLALKKGDTEYTYAQLEAAVIKLKNHLLGLGLIKGDRFSVIGENRPEWAIAYLAIVKAGLVCVPLDFMLSEAEIIHVLTESETRGILSSESHIYKIEAVKPELKNLKWIIPLNSIKDLDAAEDIPAGQNDPDSLAVLIFTSGTTGTSKAVMLSHNNIISNLKSIEPVIILGENDNMVSIIPMHHTFEATCGFLYPLYCGAAVHYPPSLKPNDLQRTMKSAEVTCVIAVPLLFEKLLRSVTRKVARSPLPTKILFNTTSGIASLLKFLRKPLFARVRKEMGLENLTHAISGGAALPAKAAKGLELLGIPILQGYGLTETSPVISVNPLGNPKNDSVGPPIPGVEVKITEPDASGIGEIVVRGPNVMLGYYKNKVATDQVLKDGWLYTGDLGHIDKDGYLYVTGRMKSIIVTQTGKNIYPEEIEEKLIRSEWIEEVLVVPRIDPDTKKEEICAIIHPNYGLLEEYSISKGVTLAEQDIQSICKDEIKKCNQDLSAYKKVTRFEIREEEFPKTTTNKIKRHLFVERGIKV
jgi:long-chain acyl-CoA synthetase